MFFMMIIYFTILFTHILKGNCIQATFSKFKTICVELYCSLPGCPALLHWETSQLDQRINSQNEKNRYSLDVTVLVMNVLWLRLGQL